MRAEFNGSTTKCHKQLHKILQDMGFMVTDEVEFDKYKVDCVADGVYGFEADGSPYHNFKKRDFERDSYIKDKFNLPIMRISDKMLDGRHDLEIKGLIKEFVESGKRSK